MKLIFAQGNPEPDYELSRHNVGFSVLNSLAAELGAKWAHKPKFQAMIAESTIGGEKVILVKPTTFYNETGVSAKKIIAFYKLNPIDDFIVIHDDLALPFGDIRVRKQGSDAGNNGIKSINSHLDHNYSRIRIGILNEFRDKMGDAAFVIGRFRNSETRQLKKTIVPHVIDLINQFCENKLKPTSYKNI